MCIVRDDTSKGARMITKEQAWIRTCQECGNKQKDNPPPNDRELSDAYRNRKCKKCKSESLDYGTYLTEDK
jgi:Zn finger protein HypA/HybF involved in hydrogenase expression